MEESNKISSPISLLSTLGKDRIVIDKSSSKEEITAFNNVFQEGRYMHQVIEDTKSDVPLMPTVNFENYQYFIRHWMDWLHFRKSYVEHNQDQNLKYFYLYKGFCKRRWKSFAMFFYSTTEMSGSIFLPTFPVFIVTTNVSLKSCKITQE